VPHRKRCIRLQIQLALPYRTFPTNKDNSALTEGIVFVKVETVRQFVRKRSLDLTTAIVAARHEDDILSLGFRLRIKAGHRHQDGLARYFESELDNLARDERKIDSSMYAPADRDDRGILADVLAAPTARRLKESGTPREQNLGLVTPLGSK
jgi:hypothetical protein